MSRFPNLGESREFRLILWRNDRGAPSMKGRHGDHRVHRSRSDRRVIAKAIMPGDDPGGFIITAIIGIVGALLGGFIAAALFDAHPLDEFFDTSTWLTAIVGAIVLLVIYRLVVDRGGHGRTLRT